MRRHDVKVLAPALVLVALVPSTAHADLQACADIGLMFARPAKVEWTDWISAGAGSHADLGGGLGFDVGILRGGGNDAHNRFELRGGPWLAVAATFPGHAAEAGLSLDLGMTSHAEWGDIALRLGAGEADLGGGERLALSATLTYGVRSVLARYSMGGGCVTGHGIEIDEPGRPARWLAHASGVRLFVTARQDVDHRTAIIGGIELEPAFLLPPYSLGRLIGGRPD